MVILGIDPGSQRVGYGLVRKEKGLLKFLDAGILKIESKKDGRVLWETKNQVERLIKKNKPEILGIEKIYFGRNRKSVLQVAQSRGVIMLVAFEHGLEIVEYSPNEVKAGVTGYGLAGKKAVAKMVRAILGKPDLKVVDDATDALAVAVLASQRPFLKG